MSFTSSLIVKFASAVQLPTAPQPVDVQLWRVATIISEDGAHESENLVETVSVTLLRNEEQLSSSFTLSNDLSPFATTNTDFGVVTIQSPVDAGFLYRSPKLKANPVPRKGGTIGLVIVKGRRTDTLSNLQSSASSRLPRPIPGLPLGFSGTVSGVTVSLVAGAINLRFTGSIFPPAPPAPPPSRIPGVPSPRAPAPPPPMAFTLTTSLVVSPSKYLHDFTRMVDVRVTGAPSVTFASTRPDLPSTVTAAILNFFSSEIAVKMAEVVASLARQLVDSLGNALSGVTIGDVLPPGRTICVQKVTITSSGMEIDGAGGAFVEIPPLAGRGSSGGGIIATIRRLFRRVP